jgi:hypothetical protein
VSHRFGFSSCSVPELSAHELLALSLASAAETIDLRAGHGQAWESVEGLRTIADAVDVAFLGLPAALGSGADPVGPHADLVEAAVERGIPIRFGVPAALERDAGVRRRFDEDVRGLRRRWGEHLVLYFEPHGPLPTLETLSELLREHGAYAAADNLGFARLSASPGEVAGFMAELGRVLQVKGFSKTGDGWTHRPLARAPEVLDDVVEFVSSLRKRDLRLTIETRCGSHVDDLVTLRAALRRPRALSA